MRTNGIFIKCKTCSKEFRVVPSQIKLGKKYCSKNCMDKPRSTIRKCLNCRKKYKIWVSRLKNGWGKYCSAKCCFTSNEFREKLRRANKKFPHKFKKGHQPWNKGIEWKEMSRKNHPNWRGGRHITKDQYIKILSKKHPKADTYGYILRTHLVVEKAIKRYLNFGEVVHHINHNRVDDRLENLYLFSNQKQHREFHVREKTGEQIISNLI